MKRMGGVRLERRPDRQTWMQRWGAGLSVAVAVVLFAVFALVLGRGAAWLDGSTLRGLTASQRASEIDTMRGYLIQIGAGVLAAGALLYTALNFQLAREGHVTDRYTKAIEQLGAARLDVRLGAIYALERIMIDSARDHPTIVEVLAAFVREHATASESTQDPVEGGQQPRLSSPTATDVQAAVTVLGRRPAGRPERGSVDLGRAGLVGAYLTRANLAGANLTDADLSHANLTNADLSHANLTNANLTDADLTGADLTDANLTDSRLIRADMTRAHMAQADLTGSYLASVQMFRADLVGALLYRADLTDAYMSRADLSGVSMDSADLSNANLTYANLTNAELNDVNMTGANLVGADLTGAELEDANLYGVDLVWAIT